MLALVTKYNFKLIIAESSRVLLTGKSFVNELALLKKDKSRKFEEHVLF